MIKTKNSKSLGPQLSGSHHPQYQLKICFEDVVWQRWGTLTGISPSSQTSRIQPLGETRQR